MSDTLELKNQLKRFEEYMIEKGRIAKSIEVAWNLEQIGFDIPAIGGVTGLLRHQIEAISAEGFRGKKKSPTELAGMLLDRRNKNIREFFAEVQQAEKKEKSEFSCRMRELGFDTPFIASLTGLGKEDIEHCTGRAKSSSQNRRQPDVGATGASPIDGIVSPGYEKIAETGVFSIKLRKMKDRRRIYKRLISSTPIDEDNCFLMQYNDWGAYKELDTSRLYAVLYRLYGKPDTFFDDFKASYNYSFEVLLTYGLSSHCRKIKIIAQIRDLKGYQDLKFWRSKKPAGEEGRFVDDIIKRGDLNICTMLLGRHFSDPFESLSAEGFEEFELYQPYWHVKFGYKNGAFFEEFEEEEESEEEIEEQL